MSDPEKIYAVIFAGGSGTRLWPISRKGQPKQVRPFLDNQTLLQKTYERLKGVVDSDQVFISTGSGLKDEVMDQLKLSSEQLFVEPQKRDTAPALGYAALKIFKKDPQAIMTNVWSDHYIQDTEAYAKIFDRAQKFIKKNPESILMAGVKPTYPETGYGYIKMGIHADFIDGTDIFAVDSFKEKPDLETAKKYVQAWEYLWNPAMFFFRVSHILDLYKKHAPELYAKLMEIEVALDTPQEEEVTNRVFSEIEPISVDYAILEKASGLFVMPADLGWSDIGHWRSVCDLLDKGEENIVRGARYVCVDSKNNLIFSETDQLISTVGMSDTLVIVSQDAILICNKEESQKVKEIVTRIDQDPELKKFA